MAVGPGLGLLLRRVLRAILIPQLVTESEEGGLGENTVSTV